MTGYVDRFDADPDPSQRKLLAAVEEAQRIGAIATEAEVEAKADADEVVTLTGNQAVAGVKSFSDHIVLTTAGKTVKVKEGSNACMGTAVMSAGTVTAPTTAVTATSRVFVSRQSSGGTVGSIGVGTRTPGTSFTIVSSSVLDTSTVAWLLVEPS
jgi:hypothetical protein